MKNTLLSIPPYQRGQGVVVSLLFSISLFYVLKPEVVDFQGLEVGEQGTGIKRK
ncbi:MAG: hypothetical protein WCT77_03500 [Bacteroidota bacterium]